MTPTHQSGEALKDARELVGLTQEQVADAMGVSRQTIVAWEGRAVVKAPKAERYLRVVRDLASPAPESGSAA